LSLQWAVTFRSELAVGLFFPSGHCCFFFCALSAALFCFSLYFFGQRPTAEKGMLYVAPNLLENCFVLLEIEALFFSCQLCESDVVLEDKMSADLQLPVS
jgi:hypothetical protein